MAILDSVIREVEQRFGLGVRSSAFVGDLAQAIFDPAHGGLPGFIARFKSAGLGDVLATWISKGGINEPISGEQVERVLGAGLTDRLGHRYALANATVRNALAFAIPRLVDLLTPDGLIADGIPADIQSFLNSNEARLPTVPVSTLVAAAPAAHSVPIWTWLLAAAWAGLLAYWALVCPHRETRKAASAPLTVSVAENASADAADSRHRSG